MFQRIKSIIGVLLSLGVASAMAENNSNIDVNQPIYNPSLVNAMARVATEGSDEAKDELLAELQQANYIAAMFTDGLKVSPSSEESQETIEKGSTFGVLSAEKDGKNYLVLFTDWEALGAYTDKKVSGWILPSKEAWSFSLQGNTYDGVVINPAHNALPLERPMLEYLSHHANQP
jgi:hypothetical protein